MVFTTFTVQPLPACRVTVNSLFRASLASRFVVGGATLSASGRR